ncbi:general substrate transporter [Tothia fuscella]|uniref:General substrate transporter n=1 Tax=Tothia fuscella TaxID=1048955 RepID=A0A9P4NI56_9PEZI|nr:general substrate transporter [Tothia fuscella]
MSFITNRVSSFFKDKKQQVVLFSSTAIALYGYDQGMMSLINTNHNYLQTMNIASTSSIVGLIVSVYYLGCAVGAVFFSWFSDRKGRKSAIFFCLATAALGNFIMFIAGMGGMKYAVVVMFIGRIIMGLGVGGVDSVIPVYSSELAEDEARGRALAQEFQMNIFGLNMAFAINLGVTRALGKDNQWAWRLPIIIMQIYPILLLAVIGRLPESPRWCLFHGKEEASKRAMMKLMGEEDGEESYRELVKSHESESDTNVGYWDMFTPGHTQFHPNMITIMGQINQALTGYGAVSVYGPQIFELLGFGVSISEYLTQANYISYFMLMTFAWLLIDAVGRRTLMLGGSAVLTSCFALLALFGGLSMNSDDLGIQIMGPAIAGVVTLYIATGAFGIGWLATVWLIPTEIFPTSARGQASAISVIVWGLANFAVTLLTPVIFNNLNYYLFIIFAATNAFAGIWTWLYLPETGNRSFEENQEFFEAAADERSWMVRKVKGGKYLKMPYNGGGDAERTPLLSRVGDQLL